MLLQFSDLRVESAMRAFETSMRQASEEQRNKTGKNKKKEIRISRSDLPPFPPSYHQLPSETTSKRSSSCACNANENPI